MNPAICFRFRVGLVLTFTLFTGCATTDSQFDPDQYKGLNKEELRSVNTLPNNYIEFSKANSQYKGAVDAVKNFYSSISSASMSLIDETLSTDFAQAFLLSNDKYAEINREDFLANCCDHGHTPVSNINVFYTEITTKDPNVIYVTVVSTFDQKYFYPRYIEIFKAVSRNRGSWLIDGLVTLPLFVHDPERNDIEIIIVPDRNGNVIDEIRSNLMNSRYISNEKIIEKLLTRDVASRIVGDERNYSVIFIFKQPPPPGTFVRVEHQFNRKRNSYLPPYEFSYRVSEATPFYMIVNGSRAGYGSSGDTVTYRVRVNWKLAEERVVTITR